ncbi:MAG TPA: sulfotransferase, partial [Paracoccus sp. (in: a-proteobacteria)]|nr:sulfotransferase [Paracoccus sp. (in: a-proteobacteria)]
AEGRVFVLSHERFSGYPPSGGFDSTIVAGRLNRSFPDARILIVLREQRASILSMYSQYVTDGGELSLRDYLTPREPFLKRMPGFSPEFYRYDRLVGHYRALFGAERVLCLVFEEFARDPAGVLARLYRFVGHDGPPPPTRTQNAKRPAAFQVLQRQVNRRLSMSELSPGRGLPLANARRRFGALSRHFNPRLTAGLDSLLEKRMKRLIESRFAGSFAESNCRLSEMIGQDLARYGYQMKDIDPDGKNAQGN